MYVHITKREAISYAGSKANLARLLKIQRQSITSWGMYLPERSANRLYHICKGKLGKVSDKPVAYWNRTTRKECAARKLKRKRRKERREKEIALAKETVNRPGPTSMFYE